MTISRWTWAAATCRGVSHKRTNLRLQDAFKCSVGAGSQEPIIVVVSDGAGTASYGGQGASLICRSISASAHQHFEAHTSLPSAEALEGWVDAARDRIGAIAARRELSPRDFAATLIVVLSDGLGSITLHVGDGCAVVR